MSDEKGISRRTFFKGAAIGAVGVAGVGLLGGCSPKQTNSTSTQNTSQNGKYSFEIAPDPIPDSEIKKTVTADVVVVGAGLAGLCASVSAAQSGAKTVVIEKRETFTARGMHNAAVGSRVQKKLGIEINKVQAIRDIVKWSGHRVNESLHWLWINNSGAAMDWLMDMTEAEGLGTTLWAGHYRGPDYFEYPVTHMFTGSPNNAFKDTPTAMLDLPKGQDPNFYVAAVLEKNAKKYGASFNYKMPAAQLLREKNGRVTGVIAGSKKAGYTKFLANKGVILCAGDYGADKEMVSRYCPEGAMADANVYTPPGGNTGDGHKMGLWIGAAMQRCDLHAPMIHTQVGGPSYCFLQVNKNGERYTNEDITPQAVCMAKMYQPDHIGWAVFDDKYLDELAQTIELGGGMFWDSFRRKWGEPWSKEDEKATIDHYEKAGLVVKANTIKELAQKMKVPADKLKATVERYNELAKGGQDLDYGKRSQFLFAIDKPPFYGSLMKSGFLVSVGGLSINNKMQVLDTKGKVIPGLYAAGNNSGEFFALDYPTIFPGHSHGRCITFGRIAGAQAAGKPIV
ncbi:MAG TPA: FAD-dependent oxidoreductase [Syntrophomonadaceae bacterium]|nr:FAD-dependent oxidoreductase [Syntrophomonadaceae bacterium]